MTYKNPNVYFSVFSFNIAIISLIIGGITMSPIALGIALGAGIVSVGMMTIAYMQER